MGEGPIEIRRVGGDVIGAGVEGSGNIVGKQITIRGNIIQLVNPSAEAIAQLGKIDAMSTAVPPGSPGGLQGQSQPEDSATLQVRIDELLTILKSNATPGGQAKEIHAGSVQLSRVDLLLKKAILLKTDADQMYFTHLERVKPQIEQARQRAGGNYELDLNEMFKEFDSGKHMAKMRESYELLQEANALDPANTEVLLCQAQLLIELTPDDPTDERRLLYRVQNLLSAPKDDSERFRLAQATFLLATAAEPVHVESLRDARQMFERLGRSEFVRQCDSLLASAPRTPAATASEIPVSTQPPATSPPAVFQPTGRWQFQITDAVGSVMIVDFYTNGMFNALQQSGANPSVQAQGQWLFNPYTQMLQFQGMIAGYLPFMLGIVIQRPHLNGFYGVGTDNCAYFMVRL